MNKQQRAIYERYLCSNYTSLLECYEKPSFAKIIALESCKDRFYAMKGTNFRIIGFNCMQFSIGFVYTVNNEKYFHYETAHNIKDWRID